MTKPLSEMTPAESYAQKLADMTGRTIACVQVNRGPCLLLPRTDWPMHEMTQEDFKEMAEDFFSSLGPITMVYPNDQTA